MTEKVWFSPDVTHNIGKGLCCELVVCIMSEFSFPQGVRLKRFFFGTLVSEFLKQFVLQWLLTSEETFLKFQASYLLGNQNV